MKLSVSPLWQRNPDWGNKLLGYNQAPFVDALGHPYNIHWYGCLITCFAMLVGKNPDEVNTILQKNGGFAKNTGNFIWSKSEVLGITQLYVSPRWTGPVTDQGVQKAKDLLDHFYPLVCEVDFNPATTGHEQHFVLLVGYDNDTFYINDPWTGDTTTLDKYGGFKRAIVQYRQYNKTFPIDSAPSFDVYTELDRVRVARDSHWNDLQKIKQQLNLYGEYSITTIQNRIDAALKSEIENGRKDKIILENNQKISELQAVNASLEKEIAETKELLQIANEKIQELDIANRQQAEEIRRLKNSQINTESFVEKIIAFFVGLLKRR